MAEIFDEERFQSLFKEPAPARVRRKSRVPDETMTRVDEIAQKGMADVEGIAAAADAAASDPLTAHRAQSASDRMQRLQREKLLRELLQLKRADTRGQMGESFGIPGQVLGGAMEAAGNLTDKITGATLGKYGVAPWTGGQDPEVKALQPAIEEAAKKAGREAYDRVIREAAGLTKAVEDPAKAVEPPKMATP